MIDGFSFETLVLWKNDSMVAWDATNSIDIYLTTSCVSISSWTSVLYTDWDFSACSKCGNCTYLLDERCSSDKKMYDDGLEADRYFSDQSLNVHNEFLFPTLIRLRDNEIYSSQETSGKDL